MPHWAGRVVAKSIETCGIPAVSVLLYAVLAAGPAGPGALAASGTRAPVLVGLLALNSSAICTGIGAGTLIGGLAARSGATTMFATAAGPALAALAHLALTAGERAAA
ncbi:hypothetical protein [Kitasatospora sp. NPDC056184]|uniref:hypothetical protein n=1 Tax=Kitasatospora sp. NPDC056184 TaxID=3345738 RepID=UPI0035DD3606